MRLEQPRARTMPKPNSKPPSSAPERLPRLESWREVLASIALDQIFSSGYSFLMEMLYMVQRGGWRVGEVPIIFCNRQQGVSKISRNEIYKALYTVLRLFRRRIFARPA